VDPPVWSGNCLALLNSVFRPIAAARDRSWFRSTAARLTLKHDHEKDTGFLIRTKTGMNHNEVLINRQHLPGAMP
jgi:hypothetical protein